MHLDKKGALWALIAWDNSSYDQKEPSVTMYSTHEEANDEKIAMEKRFRNRSSGDDEYCYPKYVIQRIYVGDDLINNYRGDSISTFKAKLK